MDISTAFLNADLPLVQKRVVVRPPQVMVNYGIVDPNELWVAEKAIYGLRVSPKAWSDYRDEELAKIEVKTKKGKLRLVQSYADPAVWNIVGVDVNEVKGYLLSYVDDFLITSKSDVVDSL